MLRRYIRSSVFAFWCTGLFALLLAVQVGRMWFGFDISPARFDPGLLVFGLVLTGFLATVALVCLYRAILHTVAPVRHPVFASLAKHGPPGEVLAAIEAELADVDHVRVLSLRRRSRSLFWHLQSGDILLTASWLVRRAVTGFGLCLVPLPLVASAERQYGTADGMIYLAPRPNPFTGVLVHLLDGRSIRIPTDPLLADRLLVEIRIRTTGARAFEEKWNATQPRVARDAEKITGAPNQIVE
jgi:hypothetical protein